MYYIAILIDSRKYQIIKLLPSHLEDSEKLTPSMVIEREVGTSKPLWSIAHEAGLIYHGGIRDDQKIDWSTATIETSGQTLTVRLNAQSENLESIPSAMSVGDFSLENEAKRWQCVVHHTYTHTEAMLVVEATIQGQRYVGSLLLHLVPQNQIYDVVMDFGSEASQVVYHRRKKSTRFRRMKLVGNLLDYYYENLKGKEVHQETEDKELYRSAFFIKKENSIFDPTAPPGSHGEQELLNLLTDKADTDTLRQENKFALVSNLKLAHLGAYNFTIKFQDTHTNAFGVSQQNFADSVVRLQQAVINYFLQTVLEEIRRSTREDRPIYLAIRLLVPNVFEQNKVAKIIYGTQQGMEQIASKNPRFQLKGVEVGTLSESDSSFLGYKFEKDRESKFNQSSFEAGKRYLVIDVGKGTTDFSIIEVDKESKKLSSKYRSGFIGAGNVLTYAFVDTVLTALVGTNSEERQRLLFKIVKRSDLSAKLRFMDVVEQFKINYNPQRIYRKIDGYIQDRQTLIRKINDPNEDPLDEIIKILESILEQQSSILDEFGIILDTVNDLATRIHRQISQSGAFMDPKDHKVLIAKLILTGRGFKFEPLVKAIKQLFGIPTEIVEELKKICLQGAFSSEAINFESNLIGEPDRYQLFGQIGRQSKSIDKGHGIIIDVPIYQNFKEIFGKIKQKSDSFAETHIIYKSEISNIPETSHSLNLTEEETFLLRGKTFEGFTKANWVISICGLDYRKHSVDDEPKVNVFFTGDEFIIRGNKVASPLQIQPEFFKTNHLVVQTLFPFVELTQPNEIPVQSLEAEEAI